MDKIWLRLVITGVVIMLVIVAWDLFLTFSGAKDTQEYTITEISPGLYGNVEDHLRSDPKFPRYEAEATQQQSSQ